VKVDVVLHHERFTASEKDTAWIAAVSTEGLIIMTRDRRIRSRPAERAVFEAAKARCFVVATGASTPLEDLRVLLGAWPRMEAIIATTAAPFMYALSRDSRLTQYIPATGPRGPAARARATRRRRGDR
jgi:hypothetical protein